MTADLLGKPRSDKKEDFMEISEMLNEYVQELCEEELRKEKEELRKEKEERRKENEKHQRDLRKADEVHQRDQEEIQRLNAKIASYERKQNSSMKM